jgi:hypothetical protein
MNTRPRIMLILAALLLCAAATPPAPAKDLLQPPSDNLTPEESAQLKQAWSKDGSPTIEVVVGQLIDGKMVNKNSPLETQLRAAILGQLRKGIDSSHIVDTSSLRIQELQDLQTVAVGRGETVAVALADAMRENFDSTLVMVVQLLPKDNGQFSVTMDVTDPGTASDIASQGFLDIDPNTDIGQINRYGCNIVQDFLKPYADRILGPDGPMYTVRLRVIGVNDAEAQTLGRTLQKLDGVKGKVDRTYQQVQTHLGFCTYTLTYTNPDTSELGDDLRDAVKGKLEGKGFFASRSSRGSIIGSVLSLKKPKWWLATDTDDNQDQVKAAAAAREKVFGMGRRLKVAVVVGQDLDSPAAAVEDPSSKVKIDFDDQALQDKLGSSLEDVGFQTINTVSLKQAKQLAQQQAARTINQPHLADAMNDKQDFEYLLYGNETTQNGSKRFEFQLIDRRGGLVVASQPWPDPAMFNANPDYQVDPNDVSEVARYITGKMVSHLDSILDSRLDLDVVVKNVDDIGKIAAISQLFKNVPNVSNVGNFNYSMPVGGFEIDYEGSTDQLMSALSNDHKIDIPMVVDVFGSSQIVINLHRRIAPELAQAPAPAPVPPTKPPAEVSQRTLQDSLKAARASVFVVGVETQEDGFDPEGTAWTVAPNKLATNVHVVEGLAEKLKNAASKHDVRVLACRFDDPPATLILGKVQIHPAYGPWNDFEDRIGPAAHQSLGVPIFDVALLDVDKAIKGDAGTPLKLATAQEMAGLSPADPVGYVGYPMEGKEMVGTHPTMLTDIGIFSAFSDGLFQQIPLGQPGVLTTTLHLYGGASGSPCFGPDGEVIGLNSAGDSDQPQQIVPVVDDFRIVKLSDGTEATDDDGLVLVAGLDTPGTPISVGKDLSAGNEQVVDQYVDQDHKKVQVPVDNQKIRHMPRKDLIVDSKGVVIGQMEAMPRVSLGFAYAQSIEMLKELLDGTADSKETQREKDWLQEAQSLHLKVDPPKSDGKQ